MGATELLLLGGSDGGGGRPAPGTPLRGQFVVTIPNAPYGPIEDGRRNPRSIFFMDEVDTVWKESGEKEARRILRAYKAMGANHITTGPAYAAGYGNDYPFTNWLSEPHRYREFHELLIDEGFEFTLFAFTDNAPYYDPASHWFDWDLVRKDFGPVFAALAPLVRRVAYMWEDFQHTDHMVPGYEMLREYFPTADRTWHNGPNHLNPGMSSQDEGHCWRVATEHGITRMSYQAVAIANEADIEVIDAATFGMEDRPRRTMEQNVYDIKDMSRRGNHGYAGFPDFEVEYMEGAAWGIYRARLSPHTGRKWYQTMVTVPGVVHVLDGLELAE